MEGNALSGLNTQTTFHPAASHKTGRQRGRQTTEEAETQAHGKAGSMQPNRQTDERTDEQTQIHEDRQSDKQTYSQVDAGKSKGSLTDRRIDRRRTERAGWLSQETVQKLFWPDTFKGFTYYKYNMYLVAQRSDILCLPICFSQMRKLTRLPMPSCMHRKQLHKIPRLEDRPSVCVLALVMVD